MLFPDLVSDGVSSALVALGRHALGHADRRDAPRLRAHDVAVRGGRVAVLALLGVLQPLVEDVLRDLRALAAAGHPRDHDHLAVLQGLQDPDQEEEGVIRDN